MNAVGTGAFNGGQYILHVEVGVKRQSRSDANSFIRHLHVLRKSVGFAEGIKGRRGKRGKARVGEWRGEIRGREKEMFNL